VILSLAVLVECRLVTDRRTHDDSKYRAGIASRSKYGLRDHAPFRCGLSSVGSNFTYLLHMHKIW